MHQIKISTSGVSTEVYVDGVPMHSDCTSFNLKQNGGETAVLTLELLCQDVEVAGDGVIVKDADWRPCEQAFEEKRKRVAGAEKYSHDKHRERQTRSRRVGALVQRLVVGAAVSMTSAVLLAEMMGVWR